MPIVITPTGQFINSETGNPVDLPPQRPDFGSGSRTGEGMQSDRGALARDVETILRNRSGAAVPPAQVESYLNMIKGGKMSLDDLQSQFVDPIMREGTGAALTPEEMQMQQAQQMSGSAISEQEAMAMNQGQGSAMSIEEKLDILMRMGLSQDEAIEAVALENSLPATDPSEFGGARAQNPGMGALGGVGAMMPPPTPRGSTNMGMPEDAIKAQRMNQVDTTGLSPQQINMLRMGIDPFAEGMVR